MQQTQPLETPVQPSTALFWPEAAREQPRLPDPFPHRMFLTWLVPGLVGTIILIAIAIYLEQRANRQIIYLTPDGALATIRTDDDSERVLSFTNLLEDASFGQPQWAPDGRRFAAIVSQRGTVQVLVAQSENITSTLIKTDERGEIFFAGDPWSADSAYLSLLSPRPDNTASLLIADVGQARIVKVGLELDLQAGLDWRQQTNELLVTARADGITPTLHIVGVNGQVWPIPLQDQQISHSDGAWSPDGQQIAYVASAKAQELAGSIWIANSDGSNAREIVGEGLNFAPV
jgi:Tol biopolymer transport system component